MSQTFIVFMVCCIVGLLWVIFILPEVCLICTLVCHRLTRAYS